MSKKKAGFKDVLSVMIDFITTFITTVVVIVAVAFVAVRLLGWEMYSVDSYSMTPAYPIDSLIVVQTVDASEIQVGDVITYVLNEEGTLVTHRVVSIDTSASTFTTKGDANESNDASPVRWENVVGKVVFGIPFLGKPLRYLTAEENRTAVIAVIIALLAFSFLWDRISAVRRKGKEKKTALEAARGEAKEEAMKEMKEEIRREVREEVMKEVREEMRKTAGNEAGGESGEEVPKEEEEVTGEDAPNEAGEMAGKEVLKEAGDGTGEKALNEVGQKIGEEVPNEAGKEISEKVPKVAEQETGEEVPKEAGEETGKEVSKEAGEESGEETPKE